MIEGVIAEEADEIERRHGPEAAAAFAGIAYKTATPLFEHLESWLAEKPRDRKTVKQYRADLLRFQAWLKARNITTIQDVTQPVVSDFRATLKGVWSTKNRTMSPMMNYWKWLKARGYAKENPWEGQSFTKQDQTRRGFTDEEMATFLQGAKGELKDAIIFSALAGGVRFGAVSNLRVRDVRDG